MINNSANAGSQMAVREVDRIQADHLGFFSFKDQLEPPRVEKGLRGVKRYASNAEAIGSHIGDS